jgi:hypothetical protein
MIEKMTGKKQQALEIPPLEPSSNYLLEMFFELGSTRVFTDNGGIQPITYTEIASYCQLTGNEFEPWEVDVIKTLDRAYIKAVYEQRDEEND